jgi:general secretion pathway protein I
MRAHRGFTLLEVLVALAVLALSAASILTQTGQGVQLQRQLELKSLALQLADSELALIGASGQWLPLGRQVRRVTGAAREWEVETRVDGTSSAELRRVTVAVRLADADLSSGDVALVSLTTFIGRY